ncbi:translocating chain-associated membrane protein 1-like isoform X2 [Varroa destructor]|uniref:TLC domain-containing protein n=1 Tax=Varroa destructor TaxID=109461 RepID=A0A7M7K258_VARDE|nr:translocating chain-associated membrane protein 1-like isoform X2 [Varroa destructor]
MPTHCIACRGGIYQFHREPTDRPIGWRSLLPAWIEWFNHHKPFGWISQRAIDEGDEVACRSIALPASETAWNLAVSIMAIKGKKSSTKSPPIFSNEFIIQNHADIVSCVAMVFVIGFFVNVTQPYAAPFVTLQHNITELHASQVFYSSGIRDLCLIFFTTLIMIVLHAVLQEYVLDKLNRKVHLSKAKHAKFNASGQLATFYALSTLWAGSILNNDGLLPLSSLWAGFPGEPHNRMLFTEKLFFIAQIAYWLHMYAELYFERVKREEYVGRISVATAHVVLFLLAYGLNLWRVGLVLTFVHYLEQTLFHVARLAYFYGHSTSGKLSGLPASMFTLRVAGLSLIGATQLYMVFAFLSFHIGRIRAYRAATQKFSKGKNGKEGKIKGAKSASIVDKSLPEADQGQGPPSPIVAKDDAKLGSLKDSNVKKRLKARA